MELTLASLIVILVLVVVDLMMLSNRVKLLENLPSTKDFLKHVKLKKHK